MESMVLAKDFERFGKVLDLAKIFNRTYTDWSIIRDTVILSSLKIDN